MASDMQMPLFLPYIQVHEFEALLLAEPEIFLSEFPEQATEVDQLCAAVSRFLTPEHIDGGQETSPAKRIKKVFPKFRKTVQGINIARRIGIDRLRSRCAHFHEWLTKLESYATESG